MAGIKHIAKRRKIRALEARRDMLNEKMSKQRLEMAAIRASLKVQRRES